MSISMQLLPAKHILCCNCSCGNPQGLLWCRNCVVPKCGDRGACAYPIIHEGHGGAPDTYDLNSCQHCTLHVCPRPDPSKHVCIACVDAWQVCMCILMRLCCVLCTHPYTECMAYSFSCSMLHMNECMHACTAKALNLRATSGSTRYV